MGKKKADYPEQPDTVPEGPPPAPVATTSPPPAGPLWKGQVRNAFVSADMAVHAATEEEAREAFVGWLTAGLSVKRG